MNELERIENVSRRLLACVCLLIAGAIASAQPDESKGKFRPDDLVELIKLDSTIKLDIRYATSDNFMKRQMYTQARAFLQRPAAEAVVRVNRKLQEKGLGLLVFDGYRPWVVTKQFWDETPPEKRSFVADPQKGSKHNRGCAIDLSLYNLKTGREIHMPSPYDDFTVNASPQYRGGTSSQRKMRDLLREAMEMEGFKVDPGEWWHFDFKDWREYRVLDIPFERMK